WTLPSESTICTSQSSPFSSDSSARTDPLPASSRAVCPAATSVWVSLLPPSEEPLVGDDVSAGISDEAAPFMPAEAAPFVSEGPVVVSLPPPHAATATSSPIPVTMPRVRGAVAIQRSPPRSNADDQFRSQFRYALWGRAHVYTVRILTTRRRLRRRTRPTQPDQGASIMPRGSDDSSVKTVVVITTGGTIASRDRGSGAVAGAGVG